MATIAAVFATREGKATSDTRADVEQVAVKPTPRTLADLLALAPDELASCDIGLMNLLCAEGLRGSGNLDLKECLSRLDGLASYVAQETSRHAYQFRERPEEFNRSEGFFKAMMMVTVLQQDLGVRYNPERISAPGVFESNEAFFSNASDVFISGLVGDSRMGTCSSMPVLYVAVGRRLGYPLKLVTTKNHLFVRWDEDNDKFNFDATGIGFNAYPDEHYRNWPMPITDAEMARYGYLRSLNPNEELAVFMSIRGHCLMSMNQQGEAIEAHAMAARLAPQNPSHGETLAMTQRIVSHQQQQAAYRTLQMQRQRYRQPSPNPLEPRSPNPQAPPFPAFLENPIPLTTAQ